MGRNGSRGSRPVKPKAYICEHRGPTQSSWEGLGVDFEKVVTQQIHMFGLADCALRFNKKTPTFQ